jgi:hypothetical protein
MLLMAGDTPSLAADLQVHLSCCFVSLSHPLCFPAAGEAGFELRALELFTSGRR